MKKMKAKHIILLSIAVLFLVLIVANCITMKGFYYTLNYPGGEMIFLKDSHCYAGLPGGNMFTETTAQNYIKMPETMSDVEACKDNYMSVLCTFISVDDGRWIGIHGINRIFLIQVRDFEKPEREELDRYSYIGDKPYFVFKWNGKNGDYPEAFYEKSMESNLKK